MAPANTRTGSELARLGKERLETIAELEHLQTELQNMAEPSADEADGDAFEREKTWALIHSLRAKLESIERALLLARRGSYGICEACKGEIDPARLEALPQATLCLRCQRAAERRRLKARP